jgi:diguanylate cyclase (GGDEF)-like protein
MFFALTSSLLLMVIRRLYLELETDMARSRCSEAAARLSEARLVRAEVASRSGNWELHLDTNEIVGSSGAAHVYGVNADSISYDEVKQLSLPEYRSVLDCAMIRLIRHQAPFDVEFRIRTADTGEIKDLHSVATYDPEARVVFGIIQDISDRKAVERKLERLVQIDMLTETFTRRQFMTLAEQEFARAIRYGSKASVMMVDVDTFKNVNDTYGHQVGDRVLKDIGLVFGMVLREADFVGRLGGEEFSVFLPETELSQAAEVAERLRKTVEQMRVPLENGAFLRVTVSIGIAPFSSELANIDMLLAKADKALYEAKRTGRNRVLLADSAMMAGA